MIPFITTALIVATQLCGGSRSQQSQDVPSRFRTTTATVIVDVLVHDRRGVPVIGLKSADFEVYEDGVRQTVTAFDAISVIPTESPSDAIELSRSTVHPKSTPSLVALVFHAMSAEARQRSEKGALRFIRDWLGPTHQAAIFHIDRTLRQLVPFARDLAALEAGIRETSRQASFSADRAGAVPGAEYGRPDPGQRSLAARSDDPFVRAHATMDALEGVIASFSGAPGRKTVVLFSQGVALMPSQDQSASGLASPNQDSWLTDNRYDHFRRVIRRAAAANVAFYTLDAGGLRIETPLIERLCFGCAPYAGLQLLAEETGGSFVENRNDLADPLRRIGSQVGSYYLLGYVPTNPIADGKYRRITVKVHRSNVRVLNRKGYVPGS